jgi:hypothetical protein
MIALDLADILAAVGAKIIGPAYTVSSALNLIDQQMPDVAVLDWQPVRETASSVAARLASLAVPFLFHTSSPEQPQSAYPGVTIVDKPPVPSRLSWLSQPCQSL